MEPPKRHYSWAVHSKVFKFVERVVAGKIFSLELEYYGSCNIFTGHSSESSMRGVFIVVRF